MELEQCVSRLAKELTQTSPGAVPWTRLLVQICGWFERQIVGVTSTDLFEYTHLELTKQFVVFARVSVDVPGSVVHPQNHQTAQYPVRQPYSPLYIPTWLILLKSELSFTFFSDRIFLNPQIAEQLRSSIREWITSERQSR